MLQEQGQMMMLPELRMLQEQMVGQKTFISIHKKKSMRNALSPTPALSI